MFWFWNKKANNNTAKLPRQMKLASSLEKGERFGETSSFGSADAHINAPKTPARAHLPPSPTSPYYIQTFDSSNHTSSRQTKGSSGSSKRMSWVRRHWFIILLIIVFLLMGLTAVILFVVKHNSSANSSHTTLLPDDVLPDSPSAASSADASVSLSS